jgi:hypothetical protein
MKTLLTTLVLLLLFGVLVGIAAVVWLGNADYGLSTVTVDGEQISGMPRFLIGAGGLFIGMVAVLFALAVVALALAGTVLVVVGALALTGLILVAVALVLLLPIIVPLVVFCVIVLATRHPNRRKVA